MASVNKILIPTKFVENTQTSQYTATGVTTVIDKFTVTNVSVDIVKMSVNLVRGVDTPSDSNKILNEVAIYPGKSYLCPELIGHIIEANGYISTLASVATSLNILCSGREIS